VQVDESGFRSLMQEQRQRAKDDARGKKTGHADLTVWRELRDLGATEWLAYSELATEATVIGLVNTDGERVEELHPGQRGQVVLDRTTFYAESGGQIGDNGIISVPFGQLKVVDVQRPVKGLVVHTVEATDGVVLGDQAYAEVDPEWRVSACQAHSGTHVVHAALRQVLGPSALQSGSYNKPGYLRLDFAWNQALSAVTRSEIEEVANLAVRQDLPVSSRYMSLPQAREWGAIALFGETYDEEVRVIEIGGPWSRELCGGTHVAHSSQIGALSITGESSVGSGSRRIEAFVGMDALRYLAKERALVSELSTMVKAAPEELPERITELLQRVKDAEKEIARIRQQQLRESASRLTAEVKDVYGVRFLGHHAGDASADELRTVVTDLRSRLGDDRPSVVAVSGVNNGRPVVVIATNAPAREWKIQAGGLVKEAAGILGGGGGGKPDLAQGGGTDVSKVGEALTAVEHAVGRAATTR
jgi:alanyl-tRNA synthetase